jgi:hypothetical protein
MAEQLRGPFEMFVDWRYCSAVMLLCLRLHNSGVLPPFHKLFKRPSYIRKKYEKLTSISRKKVDDRLNFGMTIAQVLWISKRNNREGWSLNRCKYLITKSGIIVRLQNSGWHLVFYLLNP